MKKYYFVMLLMGIFSLLPPSIFAWSDNSTHPRITEEAAKQSILSSSYLKDNLGFENGLDEIISPKDSTPQKSIFKTLSDGARTEDTGILNPGRMAVCSRGLNHFYDPLKTIEDESAGLHDVTKTSGDGVWIPPVLPSLRHWDGKSNLLWAIGAGTYSCSSYIKDEPSTSEQKSTDCNSYSWHRAREAFYFALAETNVEKRNKLFARMFRSVGQVTHLLQDMAVPAHVRNDMKGHLYYQQMAFNLPTNWFGNNFEAYVQRNPSLVAGGGSGSNVEKMTDLWDTDTYNGNGNIADSTGYGLAEYTQANFLSENKMIKLVNGPGYAHPAENDGSFDPNPVTCKDGTECYRLYFKKNQGEPIDHLYAKGYLTKYVNNGKILEITDMLDEKCYEDYAAKLLPKAISYSAGLINYFFRGTLEVSDAHVCDFESNAFTKIAAKVVNTTSNNQAPKGEVFAFARYKTPDTEDFSYAVSANQTGEPISLETTQDMVFDFSNSPIPANAKEIYLHVVYYGDLGNELATGIAIGTDDVATQIYVLLQSGNYGTIFSPITNSVVTDLQNPQYGLKKPDGSLLYPDAPEFYHTPSNGICSPENSEWSDFASFVNRSTPLDTMELFVPIYDRTHQLFDNGQQKLPIFDPNITRQDPDLKFVGNDCYGMGWGVWRIPAEGGNKNGFYNSYSVYNFPTLYAIGAWNKINKQDGYIYSSSYEESISDYKSTVSYSGSWTNTSVDDPGGCLAKLIDIYNIQQCGEMCTCINENAGQTTLTMTGYHDDTSSLVVKITDKKYTPLGPLWEKTITTENIQTRCQGDALFECTYYVGMCGIQTNNMCGPVIYRIPKSATVDWNKPCTVTYGDGLQKIISHTGSGYHNVILGQIQADLQMVMQIHYHTLEVQDKNYTEATRVTPEIYVRAQLNKQDGVYDSANDRINFKTKDNIRTEPFETAVKNLIKYSMENTGTGKDPHGISASFIMVK